MNLIIFGPPGAGKGTQSDFIANKYDLYQLSTGQVLRNEIKNKTELGKKISSIINSGTLVSDDIVKRLVENFISDKKWLLARTPLFLSFSLKKCAAKNMKYAVLNNS